MEMLASESFAIFPLHWREEINKIMGPFWSSFLLIADSIDVLSLSPKTLVEFPKLP